MNSLLVISIALVAVWLAVLTVTTLLIIRQLGLITLRLEAAPASVEDGILIGTPLPKECVSAVPELDAGLHYLVCLAPNCGPCVEFASGLSNLSITGDGVKAVFQGTGEAADELARLLPAELHVIRDPDAEAIFEGLNVKMTPSIFQVEDGIIVGKGVLRQIGDLKQFIDAYPKANTREIARINREAMSNGG